MNRLSRIVIIGIIAINAFGIFVSAVVVRDRQRTEDATLDAQIALHQCQADLGATSNFENIAEKIGSVPYDKVNNNCYDHSKAMTKALADAGIASSIIVNKDRSHAWVAVWIEGTTGRFISPKNAQNVLEMRDAKTDVVCQAPK